MPKKFAIHVQDNVLQHYGVVKRVGKKTVRVQLFNPMILILLGWFSLTDDKRTFPLSDCILFDNWDALENGIVAQLRKQGDTLNLV